MPRRDLSPIISDKHEITWSNLVQDASSAVNIVLAKGTTASLKNLSTEVLIGTKIKWIYVEMHFAAETITNPKVIHWKIHKFAAQEAATAPSLYYQLGRNRTIKRGMEMLPKNVSTVFKRIFVVRVPRGFQRIGEGEILQLSYIASSAETINACGIAIYKAYT